MRRAARGWRFGIALAGLAAGCGRAADADPRGGPLVITRGGSYSGQWASDDPDVAAVTVRTAEPVLIEHASLTGRGTLIAVVAEHADVTVRDTVGTGQNPGVAGRPPGRFLTAESFDRVVVEHCRLDHTAGIYLLTNTAGHEAAVRVVANRADGHRRPVQRRPGRMVGVQRSQAKGRRPGRARIRGRAVPAAGQGPRPRHGGGLERGRERSRVGAGWRTTSACTTAAARPRRRCRFTTTACRGRTRSTRPAAASRPTPTGPTRGTTAAAA